MKTITVEIKEDEILVAIKRPEECEDCHPQLVAEDAMWHTSFEWRLVELKENT